MMTDVALGSRDPGLAMILSAIGGGKSTRPTRLAEGRYQCTHWSFEHSVRDALETWPEDLPGEGLDAIGVCDSPDQFWLKFGGALADSTRKFVVSFVEVSKADQPIDGGWRWHKWGGYVGDGEPTTEYLHDEPKFDRVFTYHVYEVKS